MGRTKINVKSIKFEDEMTAGLGQYFDEVKNASNLTQTQEIELYDKFIDGDKRSGDILIEMNLKFVISIAKHYSPGIKNTRRKAVEFIDLVSAGNEGLIKAVYSKKWDHSLGFKFLSYAVWNIRASIDRLLNYEADFIRIPQNCRNVISKGKKMNLTMDDIAEENRHSVVVFAIEAMEKEIISIYTLSKERSNYYDEGKDDYEYEDFNDCLVDEESMTVFDRNITKQSFNTTLVSIFKTIDQRRALCISLLYGLFDGEPMSVSEIAKHGMITSRTSCNNVTPERIRQLISGGIKNLRHFTRVNHLQQYIDEDL